MLRRARTVRLCVMGFNEAAGADPADALARKGRHAFLLRASMRPRGQTPRMLPAAVRVALLNRGFNEAAGADPADACLSPPCP